MKNSTPSTRRTKRRGHSQEADIEIRRNGKTMVIIRKRPGEVEVSLAPEIRDIPGVQARFKYYFMQKAEQFIDAELHDELTGDAKLGTNVEKFLIHPDLARNAKVEWPDVDLDK
jgi:hypothetical protein